MMILNTISVTELLIEFFQFSFACEERAGETERPGGAAALCVV